MINTEDLEYISEEELIERYMDLIHDYEEVVEHNDRLCVENSELNDDLNMVNKEIEYSDDWLEKKLQDVKFGTELQNSIIGTVLKYAEEFGVRFEVLNLPISAEHISNDLKSSLKLTNAIGELIIKYFED